MAGISGARSIRIRIEGRVQGVGYRAWTARRARALGLAGWVRNRADGSVEAVLQGEAQAIERMLADCRAGPPAALVSAVTVVGEAEEALVGFEVRASA